MMRLPGFTSMTRRKVTTRLRRTVSAAARCYPDRFVVEGLQDS
ncbi:MAG: hypothetical protein ABI835_10565 [Chloroflexota bacterium]